MVIIEATKLAAAVADRQLFTAERLVVRSRDRIGLVGMNGAGKTTLLHVLAGIREPEEGSVAAVVRRALIPQLKNAEEGLSGGETTARYIERAFAEQAGLILADEPTMHLDAAHIEALEQRFKRYDGAIVVVSHDRAFLDAVCTAIWAVEDGVVRTYKGNYRAYEEQRALEKRQHAERYDAYVEKRQQLEQAVQLKKGKASGMLKAPKRMSASEAKLGKAGAGTTQKGVHSAIKALETRIEKLERVDKPREQPRIKLDIPNASLLHGQAVIRLDGLSAAIGDRELWRDARASLKAGSKAALIGANGAGKSTLVKRIVERAQGVAIKPAARIGYYSQSLDILDAAKSVMDNVKRTSVQEDALIRTVLARLLFRRDDVHKPVAVLSGGERVRAAFAKLFLSDANVLVMDEPTSFLDIPSIEAFESLLQEYEGTVLFVSHDRRFVEAVADCIWEIRDGRLHVFDGTLVRYREHMRQRETSSGPSEMDEELLRIETALAETLGMLSLPGLQPDRADELEAAFKRLAGKRNALRRELGRG